MGETYSSEYGAERPLTAHQKLSEIACSRIAHAQDVSLPERFWRAEPWKRIFGQQMRGATRLLRIYDPRVVFATLENHPRARSLLPTWFAELCEVEQRRSDAAITDANRAVNVEEPRVDERPRVARPASGVRTKLKGL